MGSGVDVGRGVEVGFGVFVWVGKGVSVGTGVAVAANKLPPEQARTMADREVRKMIFITKGIELSVFMFHSPQR